MTDIYRRLIDADSSRQSLLELVDAVAQTNQFELDQAAEKLGDRERARACIAVADRVRGHKTLSSLELGALLMLFQMLTDEESRGRQFQTMEEETGIKRTQLYRTIAMFREFGRVLLADPDVASRCTCEALKILSGESVSDDARAEAIEHVRDGNHLTIKVAKDIQRQHASLPSSAGSGANKSDAKPSANEPNRSEGSNALWQFAATNVRIVIQPSSRNGVVGGEDIVLALEAALQKARRDYVASGSNQQLQLA